MSDSTIVHISIRNALAVVTYNGVSRLFRLKRIDPLGLANLYRTRGYKYSWLDNDTILLTKKVTSLRRAA